MNKIQLTIAGEYYNISTDDDINYVASLGEELDEKLTAVMNSGSRLSATQAAVLTALECLDSQKKVEINCRELRNQVREYLDEAAKARSEAEIAKREIEHLNGIIAAMKNVK